MVCEHLAHVERALLESGVPVTFRGQAWSEHCREWVYFDCFINTSQVRQQFHLSSVVADHTHRGTHDGQEHGIVCTKCHDALMGLTEPRPGTRTFPPRGPA